LGTLHWGGGFDAEVDALLGIDDPGETLVSALMVGGRAA
jgi:hypothetical protein